MSKVSVQHDKQEEAISHWNGAKWPISTTRSGHEEQEVQSCKAQSAISPLTQKVVGQSVPC